MNIYIQNQQHILTWTHVFHTILVATWHLSTLRRASSLSSPTYSALVSLFLRSLAENGTPVAINVAISSISLDMWVFKTLAQEFSNCFVYLIRTYDLRPYCIQAWQLWDDGRWIDLVDASLVPKSHSAEMTKCIKIALLCVQENATDRPTMAEVVAMLSLSSETAMIVAEPKQPAYFNVRVGNEETSTPTESCSINDVTISVTTPR